MYPQKAISEKDTCTPMFTEALFMIARTWKQPRCPSTDEWTKKLWYVCVCVYIHTHTHTHTHTLEYYSAIKRNTFESVVMRWMNLQPIIQGEVNQKEKQISFINSYI